MNANAYRYRTHICGRKTSLIEKCILFIISITTGRAVHTRAIKDILKKYSFQMFKKQARRCK